MSFEDEIAAAMKRELTMSERLQLQQYLQNARFVIVTWGDTDRTVHSAAVGPTNLEELVQMFRAFMEMWEDCWVETVVSATDETASSGELE